MGQKLREDKFGTLTHSSGTITMAASSSSPVRLTIGGQQYKVSSLLNIPVAPSTANTLYMIYAKVAAGVVSLVKSTNPNSIGPAGETSWKLVGAFFTGATDTFGSFVNIAGTPRASGISISAATTFTGVGSPADKRVLLDFQGTKARIYGWVETGTLAASPMTAVLSGITIRASAYETSHDFLGMWARNSGPWLGSGDGGVMAYISGQGTDRVCFTVSGGGDTWNTMNGNAGSLANSDTACFWFEFETNEFSATPLSDR